MAAKSAARPGTQAPSNPQGDANLPRVDRWFQFKYGASTVPPESWDERPRALLIFSGRSRPGDLAAYLHDAGWIVVAIDLEADIATDMLAESTWEMVKEDLKLGAFDAVGIATPCGTFSPLRESPPGPRPLRSLERPMGLPTEQLTEAERKQLSQSNRLLEISAKAFLLAIDACKGVWWENPDHGDKLDMWKTPIRRDSPQETSASGTLQIRPMQVRGGDHETHHLRDLHAGPLGTQRDQVQSRKEGVQEAGWQFLHGCPSISSTTVEDY